jgi:hypothetical protein
VSTKASCDLLAVFGVLRAQKANIMALWQLTHERPRERIFLNDTILVLKQQNSAAFEWPCGQLGIWEHVGFHGDHEFHDAKDSIAKSTP